MGRHCTEAEARFYHRQNLRAAGLPIPAELLIPTDSEREVTLAIWARYDREVSELPPMQPDELRERVGFIKEALGIFQEVER